jgi:GNAT superfamily N-acetyltransferase
MPVAPHTDVATLQDGSQVVIRPLRRGDRPAFIAAFERLGEQSRYRRFLGPMPSLTESQLRHLTDVDQRDHVALAAIDATAGSGIVGVARFIRLAGADVEPALAVVDDWQARGLGTVLLAALVRAARAQGVRRFQAYVLADNVDMLRLLGGVGELRTSCAGPAVHVTVDLAEPAGSLDSHATYIYAA